MKKIGAYFAIGYLVAIIGIFFSDICGNFLMEWTMEVPVS